MEWVVTTGRTVEEAKDAALDQLGVDEADAEFDILEEPRQGLFGRQRGEARVRARVRPTVPRPKIDRRDRRRRRDERARDGGGRGDASREGGNGAEAESGPPGRGKPARAGRTVPSSDVSASDRSGSASDGSAGSASGDRAGAAPGRSGSGRGRRRSREGAGARSGGPGQTPADTTGGVRTAEADDDEEMSEAQMEEHSLAEQGDEAQKFLVGLLEQFGVSASVSVIEVDDETVEVRVEGNDLGLLIGPRGQTLAALQDLARTVVQRHTPSRNGRLVVDVAGYRQRRREALERFTRQVAQDVVSSGIQKVLEPMSAADRKIVHDTANQIPGVHTTSEGEDPRRRVVILPGPAPA